MHRIVNRHVRVDMCTDMFANTDMRVDMCADTYIIIYFTLIGTCVCVNMRVDMCADLNVQTCVQRSVWIFIDLCRRPVQAHA